MGFHEPEEKKIVPFFPFSVSDDGIGNLNLNLVLIPVERRPITGQVEEVSWAREPRQLLAREISLQTRDYQASNAADIDPRADNGQGMRLIKFRNGVVEIESTQSHK